MAKDVWTKKRFIEKFGRQFDQGRDAVILMNGDYDTCPYGVMSAYRQSGGVVAAVLTTSEYRGSCRLNYVVALGA